MTAPSVTAVRLADFNAAPPEVLVPELLACALVPRWAGAIALDRPFDDREALLEEADRLARTWTDEEVKAALDRHPRIGERSTVGGAEAAMSVREQSGVAAEHAERLRAGNAEYERRFGRVFLIRAAGRTGVEVLAALERRLGNDEAQERVEVSEQLREIALLRLEALVPA